MVTLFVLGVLCAVLLDEVTGITPGGYIVPGFLALSASSPLQLGVTLGVVLAVMALVRGLERLVLLYGRRRLVYAVLSGVLIKVGLMVAAPRLGALPAAALVVGYVVPRVMAERCLKQGFWITTAATALATSVAFLLGRAVLG